MNETALPVDGRFEIDGRLPHSSNYTFLVTLPDGTKAIYKPEQGEQPLFDFPEGLYRREVAAYRLAQLLGWPNVPETVATEHGPYGPGSLQRFIEADFTQHYFSLFEDDAFHPEFQKVAAFDMLANNADRKSGHCLVDTERAIWCIDHGLCFHVEPKLRTVIWEFETTAVPEVLLDDVRRVSTSSLEPLRGLLDDSEIDALQARMLDMVERPVYPEVVSQRQYPWPLL